MMKHLGISLRISIVSIALFGFIYPFAMTALAQAVFPYRANGSLVERKGVVVGSELIGQLWTKPEFFHGRPSAAGKNGYDPTNTGATNLAPSSKKLIDSTKATIAALQKENPNATISIPTDLVTSSASGIDPDISPEAAYYQASRVAAARHLSADAVNNLIGQAIEGRTFGFLGEPHVNVLKLNLMLEDRP